MISDASPPDWAASLWERRNAVHLSRNTLAAESGISAKTIQAIELGYRRPRPDTRAALDRVIAERSPEPTVEERLARLERVVLANHAVLGAA